MDTEAQQGCGKGNLFFWRWYFSEGWVLRLGVGAVKVNDFFGDGISVLDGY